MCVIPEIKGKVNVNITYSWWCNKCQAWHGDPSCPFDNGMSYWPADNGMNYLPTADNRTYEICPHCGQEIKK